MLRRYTKFLGVLGLGFGMAAMALFFVNSTESSQVPVVRSFVQDSADNAKPLSSNDRESFAFIELFTSQGCSSCPSADRNLSRIAAAANASGKNVYTLSYHVDYWNYLGWKDPYSSAKFSDRQRQYARQFDSTQVYTPQMVVNGQAEFVGSKQKVSDRVVSAALELDVRTSVRVIANTKNKKVIANWEAEGLSPGDFVNVALVQNKGTQKVKRGENAHRDLSHINIVRQLKSDRNAGKTGTVELEMPAGFNRDGYHVVAFVQSPKNVRAAARTSISEMEAKREVEQNKMKSEAIGQDKKMKSKSSSIEMDQNGRVTTFKPGLQQKNLVGADRFLQTLNGDWLTLKNTLNLANQNWDVSYVPMLLEVGQFLPPRNRAQVVALLESKTRKKLGSDFDKWFQWNWKQKYDQHPEYGKFKSELYKRIDPRFAEYFVETKDSKIRLDEIRWGGVKRDGIPPLNKPKMLTAKEQKYLRDTNVVFGIELNGEARAYPKRILAWHEMFKDTIGGESVCGVY